MCKNLPTSFGNLLEHQGTDCAVYAAKVQINTVCSGFHTKGLEGKYANY